jgi:hypothetical protein
MRKTAMNGRITFQSRVNGVGVNPEVGRTDTDPTISSPAVDGSRRAV